MTVRLWPNLPKGRQPNPPSIGSGLGVRGRPRHRNGWHGRAVLAGTSVSLSVEYLEDPAWKRAGLSRGALGSPDLWSRLAPPRLGRGQPDTPTACCLVRRATAGRRPSWGYDLLPDLVTRLAQFLDDPRAPASRHHLGRASRWLRQWRAWSRSFLGEWAF